jgi:choloylglycine hydrolase
MPSGWPELHTGYPPADHRPTVGILEWIQYNLDQHASVAEVVANAEAVRPTSRIPIHYFFADASGDAAAIEFLDGKLVVHRGESLPVRALANSTYADSVAAFEAAKRTGEMPTFRSSLDRFVRGAMLASGDGDSIARSFAILAAVARPGFTRWSIVYDLGAGEVYFKTDTNEAIRHFTVTGFDLSCRTPVQILDVTAPGSDGVEPGFVDYTRTANHALLEASYVTTPFLQGRSDTEKAAAAAHADVTSSCAVTN